MVRPLAVTSVALSSELSTASSVASRTASNRPDTPSVGRTVRGCGPAAPSTRSDGVRREGDREVAAAVRVGRPGPREREHGARGEALQVPRVERRVGRDDDHAGSVSCALPPARAQRSSAVSVSASGETASARARRQLLPHRHAVDDELAAVVALHEDADGPRVVAWLPRPSATTCRCRPSSRTRPSRCPRRRPLRPPRPPSRRRSPRSRDRA